MRVSDARLLAWANVTHPKNEMDDMALDLIDARERIAELEASYQIALGTAARMREANSRVLQQAQAGQTRICNQRKELHRQGQRIAELEKDAEEVGIGGNHLASYLIGCLDADTKSSRLTKRHTIKP